MWSRPGQPPICLLDASLVWAAVFIFAFTFCGFYLAPVRTPWDSAFSIHTAYSLLHGHWGSLSEFGHQTHHFVGLAPDGQPYSVYPVGPSLFALPIVAMIDLVVPGLPDLLRATALSTKIEALTVAFWCSIATVMMLYLARWVTKSNLVAIIAAFIFAFCSPILSSATRALWQHGPLVVCTLTTMLILRTADLRPKLIPLAGLSVAAAFVCRPMAFPLVLLVAAYVALYHRDRLAAFVTAVAAVALAWVLYNYSIWGSWLSPYFKPSTHVDEFYHFGGRILGSLISPARGLLVFSPVFAFSIVGVLLKVRDSKLDRFDALCIAMIVSHVVVVAFIQNWWAGHSFGPRLMTDIVPMLVYLMLPAIVFIGANIERASGAVMASVMAGSIAVSLFINAQGAFNAATGAWNVAPVNIDKPEGYARLWDWNDLQFLRGTNLDPTQRAP
jgi:hypothetical protein